MRCQNFKFEPVSSELGLSQNFISDIEIDSSGFVWVATPSGLNRFDGYSFKTFKNDPLDSLSLAGSKITAIELDHKGRLWVAHEAGVQFFDLDTGELNPLLFQLHFTPKFLLIDSDGVIWAIDSKRQVHRFQERDDGSF
ncbi:MAG: ligand-binding sensor domain-containing protein, partial [Flavobacteriales bacterium]